MVGGPYDALKQACYGAQRDRLLLVQYETLTTEPARAMHAIYEFIDEPAFDHAISTTSTMTSPNSTTGPAPWVATPSTAR